MPAGLYTYFLITGFEVGNYLTGKLQYQSDAINNVWTDLGNWEADSQGIINIDAENNTIPIDYNLLTAGNTYLFRLVDTNRQIVSNVVEWTIPIATSDLVLGDGDGDVLGDGDGDVLGGG